MLWPVIPWRHPSQPPNTLLHAAASFSRTNRPEPDTASTTNTIKSDVFITHTHKDHTYPRSIETLYKPAATTVYLELTPNFDDFDLSVMVARHSDTAQQHCETPIKNTVTTSRQASGRCK